MKSVFEIYPYWERARKTVIQAAKMIPKGKLEWRPAKGMLTFGDILRHMVDCEEFWIHDVLLRKGGNPDRKRRDFPTAVKILKDWEGIHKKTVSALSKMPISSLSRKVKIEQDGQVPVGWILWHVVEHEVHHRGQLITYLRILGLEPPQI